MLQKTLHSHFVKISTIKGKLIIQYQSPEFEIKYHTKAPTGSDSLANS